MNYELLLIYDWAIDSGEPIMVDSDVIRSLFSAPRKPNARKTVCVDCRYIRERPSGIATIVQALVDYLPELAPDLDFLFLKHPKGPERLSFAPNVREQVVPEEANGPATLFWMNRIADLRGVDLFHNTFNILPYRLKIPTVIMVTDVMWIKHPTWARGPGMWGHVEVAFYRQGMWNAIKHADRIIAISEATKREIGSLDPSATARTRVALEGIAEDYHAMDGAEGERLIESVRRRYLGGAKRYVLTVGQFSVYKNHTRVLEAFAKAFRDQPDMHLAFVQRLGKGPEVLRPMAKKLGVDDRVHFLHNLPLIDIVAVFNGATTLCHPSLYEGFGNPPAEAMACDCPVITSNRSSMPEVSGVAAELVEPESVEAIAQALRKVAGNEALRESMRARGLERAKQLTWKAHVEGNLAAYREVLDQNCR